MEKRREKLIEDMAIVYASTLEYKDGEVVDKYFGKCLFRHSALDVALKEAKANYYAKALEEEAKAKAEAEAKAKKEELKKQIQKQKAEAEAKAKAEAEEKKALGEKRLAEDKAKESKKATK